MKIKDVVSYLKQEFPSIKFYNGTIDKNQQCVGVYARGSAAPNIAIGGVQYSSYCTLPITLLVHWGENADICEETANTIHKGLLGKAKLVMGTANVISVSMLDPGPINVQRDSNNICEMVIRANIFYEREVS
ncbi:MAG: hypothetical protein N3B21_19305 [Clostridia bacterium]|nr:hypothetical protein [Clostridia bacterium]